MIGIKVPATSANWGPAFDSVGVAFNLYNFFYAEEIDKGLVLEGFPSEFNNEKNLVYTSMIKGFEYIGYKPKGLKILMKGDIPDSRGLGSSASCIVAGVMLSNEISKSNLSKEDILKIATKIEGHPDNVAPAIFGNFVISLSSDDTIKYDSIDIKENFKFISLIPEFKLSTEESRGILPKIIEHKDAVFNLGRVSLLISSLYKGNYENLKLALEDKMHQSYRGDLIPYYNEIVDFVKNKHKKGLFLSGAGPSIIVIDDQESDEFLMELKEFLKESNLIWNVKQLEVDRVGASLIDSKN